MPSANKFWKILLGFGLSVIAIIVILTTVDFSLLSQALARADWRWFILTSLIMATSYLLRAWRWKNLLLYEPMPPFIPRYKAVQLGFFINSILPLRVGEFARPMILRQLTGVPYSVGLASILTERIADGYTLFSYLIFLAIISNSNSFSSLGLGMGAMVLTLAGTVLIVLLWANGKRTARFVRIIIHRFSPRFALKAEQALHRFSESLPLWRSPLRLLQVYGKSLLVWAIIALTVVPAAVGYGIIDRMTILSPLWIMVFTVTGVAIPSMPANIGIFELSAASGLIIAVPGTDWSTAVGFGLLLHIAQLVPVYIIGLYLLWRGNIGFTNAIIMRETTKEDNDDGL
jgi:glycosyltransferase 2 family protein